MSCTDRPDPSLADDPIAASPAGADRPGVSTHPAVVDRRAGGHADHPLGPARRADSWRSRVGGRLDREWALLRHDRRALTTVRDWHQLHAIGLLSPVLARTVAARDLGVIVAATSRDAGGDPDGMLRELLAISASDALAARIVLQRIIPGLVAGARRYHRTFDGDDVLDHVLPAAWIAIGRYDLDRRRGPVAPSLISDAIALGLRTPYRRRATHPEVPTDQSRWHQLPAAVDPTGLDELAEVVHDARSAGVPTTDLDLVRHLVSAGSPSRVAVERGVTPRTVRNHRDRAVERIRRAVSVPA